MGCAPFDGAANVEMGNRKAQKNSTRMICRVSKFLLFLSTSFFVAAVANETDYANRTEMNGYSLSAFGDFVNQWKLVTVRYREDTNEMRFTYANKMAAEALAANSTDYPDGAVFGKVGFVTEKDSAFVSSVVPSGAKRYQFMVRDKKKFAETDGWGYVIFNGEGRTINGEPKQNSLACAACHHIVPERGFVFSQFAAFQPFVEKQAHAKSNEPSIPARIAFSAVPAKGLTYHLQRLLPKDVGTVQVMQGPLKDHIFEGTVNEVGPLLAKEAVRSNKPAALAHGKNPLFAFAYVDAADKSCPGGQVKVVVGRSIVTNKKAGDDETIVKLSGHCESRGGN